MPSVDSYLGSIDVAGFNYACPNFAIADGSTIPISQNTALYSLFGPTYGGDFSTTSFSCPIFEAGCQSAPARERDCRRMRSGRRRAASRRFC